MTAGECVGKGNTQSRLPEVYICTACMEISVTVPQNSGDLHPTKPPLVKKYLHPTTEICSTMFISVHFLLARN